MYRPVANVAPNFHYFRSARHFASNIYNHNDAIKTFLLNISLFLFILATDHETWACELINYSIGIVNYYCRPALFGIEVSHKKI